MYYLFCIKLYKFRSKEWENVKDHKYSNEIVNMKCNIFYSLIYTYQVTKC